MAAVHVASSVPGQAKPPGASQDIVMSQLPYRIHACRPLPYAPFYVSFVLSAISESNLLQAEDPNRPQSRLCGERRTRPCQRFAVPLAVMVSGTRDLHQEKCDLMCVNGTSGLQVRYAVACKHPCFRFHIFRLTFRCAGSVCIAAEQVRLSKSKSWGIGHGSEREGF